jgi:hypothetical protein
VDECLRGLVVNLSLLDLFVALNLLLDNLLDLLDMEILLLMSGKLPQFNLLKFTEVSLCSFHLFTH